MFISERGMINTILSGVVDKIMENVVEVKGNGEWNQWSGGARSWAVEKEGRLWKAKQTQNLTSY